MTQKRWVDVEDFATDSEREAIDGDEPEPEIGWRASLDVWPQLCSRTLVVQVIVCDTMDAYTMQLPFLAALRSELFDIGYTNALGYRAPFLHCSGGAGGFSVYIRSGSIAGGTPHSSGHRTITAWQAARHLAA